MERKYSICLFFHLALPLLCTEHLVFTAYGKYRIINTDIKALLMFKAMITKDPTGVLSHWQLTNRTKVPCISWPGVSCSHGRVTQLNLTGLNLVGSLNFSPLASLDMLLSLDLSTNSFSVSSTSLLQLPPGLKQLQLFSSGLSGQIPENIFLKCPNLVYVNLSHNNLSGFIPQNLCQNSSYKFRVLDLSVNNLTGPISSLTLGSNLKTLNLSYNLLTGEIPHFLANQRSIKSLDLSHNYLTGWMDPQRWQEPCNSLVVLRLSDNGISGPIPSPFSCSWLRILDLSTNNISGPFPDAILQNLTSLEILILGNNNISESFPASISYCKSLRVVDFSSNRLSGVIPPSICPGAASLEELRMPDNMITGELPRELSHCLNLKTIDLSINYVNGTIPPQFGVLQNLEQLMAWFNALEGEIPAELGKCKNLKHLILNNNFLHGKIPVELSNCKSLEWLALTSNGVNGEIPREFGLLPRLYVLQLANNSLSGEIPRELANCSSLVWLDLSNNNLIGEIPVRLGRQLGENAPTGGIDLSANTLVFVRTVGNSCQGVGGLLEFAGIRPERVSQIPALRSCDFTRTYSGPVLQLFTQYQTMKYLDLSYNELRGNIPTEMGDMVALQVLELAHNSLSGQIPSSLGQLRDLGVFDASHNRLQGHIPESFSNLSFLVQVDLSNNELTGQIPTRGQLGTLPASQYANNPGLCGVPLPECLDNTSEPSTQNSETNSEKINKRARSTAHIHSIFLAILIPLALICIMIICGTYIRARHNKEEEAKMLHRLQVSQTATTWKISKEKEPLSINVATFQRQLTKLKFSQLIEATNSFCASSLIGCGGFGEVFKATLKDGSTVAIKKLFHMSSQGDREFMAEMETLGKINHQNLVPLLGYCKVGEERLLVYEFMEFGSLDEVLHGRRTEQFNRPPDLRWEERKKIARGAARGLCFLHHSCFPHIIHRDMKSSNVLLDSEMEARVSDFGMARLISALDTHLSVSTLAGTPGYVPPEYYQSFRCTAKGDVYSFGVVLLELLTGARPTNKEEFGDTNLVGWVKMKTREGKVMEVIDPKLLWGSNTNERTDDEVEEGEEVKEMLKYLEITMRCVEEFPSRRPDMLQVVSMLRELAPAPGNQNNNTE